VTILSCRFHSTPHSSTPSADAFITVEPWTFSCGYTRQTVAVRHFIYLNVALPTSPTHSAIYQPFEVLDPPYIPPYLSVGFHSLCWTQSHSTSSSFLQPSYRRSFSASYSLNERLSSLTPWIYHSVTLPQVLLASRTDPLAAPLVTMMALTTPHHGVLLRSPLQPFILLR
jgi:hypothetical protein